jgi:hypothetical protein
MNLLPNQQSAKSYLLPRKVGALFMEPGTGKTRTAMELIKSVPDVDYILWLCPYQCIHGEQAEETTPFEVQKWGGFEAECEFAGIESLSNSNRLFLELYTKLERAKRPFVICDESLKIKNWSSVRTRRIVELGKLAEYKLILNGTPLSRNLLDLWPQFEFLSPKILNMGIAEYKNTFCEYTILRKRIGNRVFTQEWISKYHNVDYLYSLIRHYVYECDLELALKTQYIDIPYTLDLIEKEQYQYIKSNFLDNEKLRFLNPNIFIELTQKMQHLYCCSEQKLQIVERLIKEYGIDNIVVYRKFIDSEIELSKRFPGLRVLGYQKHAHGLNCQKYNVLIEFDKTFNYAELEQAHGRILRQGQNKDCFFISLTGNVGLEYMINENIEKKQNLLEYFNQKGAEIIREL